MKEAEAANIDNPIFILDNARIHHYRGLQETIEELNLKIIYLRPYSPFLNPRENFFLHGKTWYCEVALGLKLN